MGRTYSALGNKAKSRAAYEAAAEHSTIIMAKTGRQFGLGKGAKEYSHIRG